METVGAICNECGDLLFSRHPADFRVCTCDNLSVSGGVGFPLQAVVHAKRTKTWQAVDLSIDCGTVAMLTDMWHGVDNYGKHTEEEVECERKIDIKTTLKPGAMTGKRGRINLTKTLKKFCQLPSW